jgi:hypothetical protein
MRFLGNFLLSRDSAPESPKPVLIPLSKRRYHIAHRRRYHPISPVGSRRRLIRGYAGCFGRRSSIKSAPTGIGSACEARNAAARGVPRHRLPPFPGPLDLGDEVPAAGLTYGVRWSRTSLVATREGRSMVGSGRMLLRRASILLLFACAGMAFAAPAPAQAPRPDPGPPPPPQPKPEAPGTTPPPPPPATSPPSPPPPATPPPPPPPARVQVVTPPPPAPPVLSPPALSQRPVVSPPPAPAQRARARTNQTSRTKKKKVSTRARTAKPAASQPVRRLPAAGARSSSPDSRLLIGGLALVVLVLGDTVFLALSTRVLRGV